MWNQVSGEISVDGEIGVGPGGTGGSLGMSVEGDCPMLRLIALGSYADCPPPFVPAVKQYKKS